MSTIYGLIPKNSKPFTTSNIFTAQFNVPTLGKYDFTATPGNRGQTVFRMVNSSVYFIASLSFSATTPEGDFLSAIDISAAANFPQWRLRFNSDQTILHPYPFPVVTYFDDRQFQTFVSSQQSEDILLMDFSGVLNQIAALVGVGEIRAQVSTLVYEIIDNNWIKPYRDKSASGFFKI